MILNKSRQIQKERVYKIVENSIGKFVRTKVDILGLEIAFETQNFHMSRVWSTSSEVQTASGIRLKKSFHLTLTDLVTVVILAYSCLLYLICIPEATKTLSKAKITFLTLTFEYPDANIQSVVN